MTHQNYFVYIATNPDRHTVLYIGVTNDVGRRVFEHRNGMGSEFARKYRVTRLVYVEEFENPTEAIAREKQLEGWKRIRKTSLSGRPIPNGRTSRHHPEHGEGVMPVEAA